MKFILITVLLLRSFSPDAITEKDERQLKRKLKSLYHHEVGVRLKVKWRGRGDYTVSQAPLKHELLDSNTARVAHDLAVQLGATETENVSIMSAGYGKVTLYTNIPGLVFIYNFLHFAPETVAEIQEYLGVGK